MEGMTDFDPSAARACILIINWNGKENLRECLKSCILQDYHEYDATVIDNASTDGSVEMIQTEFPQVRLIKNRSNIGFTGAGNAGMQYAAERGYRYVLLLANDVILDPRCLSQSIKYSQQNPLVGMIGFRLLGALSYIPIEDLHKASTQWRLLEAEDTNWIEGAAYLIDPRLFIRLGGYDDLLFMYGDENDLENRIRRAGYSLNRINVPAWHNAGRNVMGRRKIRAAYYAFRNTLIVFFKEKSWQQAFRSLLPFVRIACDPSISVPDEKIIMKRYRPCNIFINIIVILAAMLSFLWNLPHIYRNKKKHLQLSLFERERFEKHRKHNAVS
jgi:GT2 family glycosyltransferase